MVLRTQHLPRLSNPMRMGCQAPRVLLKLLLLQPRPRQRCVLIRPISSRPKSLSARALLLRLARVFHSETLLRVSLRSFQEGHPRPRSVYRLTSLFASGSVSTWIYSIPFLGATSDTCQDCGPIQWPDGTRFSFALACTFTVSSLQAFAPQGVEYLPCTFGITDHTCIPIGMDFINNMNVIYPRVKTVKVYKYQGQTGLFHLTSSLAENCGPTVCRLFDTS